MSGANEFCTRNPHHEGVEVFGSQKQKSNTSIGTDEETYGPNTINFFWPHLVKRVTKARTATLPTIVKEVKTFAKQVQPSPLAGTDVHRITAV